MTMTTTKVSLLQSLIVQAQLLVELESVQLGWGANSTPPFDIDSSKPQRHSTSFARF